MKANRLLTLTLAACAAWPVLAADETPPPPKEEPPKQEVEENSPGQAKQVSSLSKEFGVTEAEVTALRDRKMGWGEIRHALAISRKSGKPLSEILALRDKGMGWGQIAKEQGFSLGEAGKNKGAPPPARGGGPGRSRGHGGGPKR